MSKLSDNKQYVAKLQNREYRLKRKLRIIQTWASVGAEQLKSMNISFGDTIELLEMIEEGCKSGGDLIV